MSSSKGFVLTDSNTLLRTNDGGHTWTNVTPQGAATEVLTIAHFLNQQQGWAVTATHSPDGNVTQTRVLSTVDGGSTWKGPSAVVPVPTLFLAGLSGYGFLSFADAKNGWLGLSLISSSAFRNGLLFRTQDGGRSWVELPRPPIVDDFVFVSKEAGYIAGGAADSEFYRTQDGGVTWMDARPSIPKSASGRPYYAAPKFDKAGRGFLPITIDSYDDLTMTLLVYSTDDGGVTWVPYSTRAGIPGGGKVPFSPTGAGAIIGFKSDEGTLRTETLNGVGFKDSRGLAASGPAQSSGVLEVSFVDAYYGWFVVSKSDCSLGKKHCTSETRLLSTEDGGLSTLDITPPNMSSPATGNSSPATGNAIQWARSPT